MLLLFFLFWFFIWFMIMFIMFDKMITKFIKFWRFECYMINNILFSSLFASFLLRTCKFDFAIKECEENSSSQLFWDILNIKISSFMGLININRFNYISSLDRRVATIIHTINFISILTITPSFDVLWHEWFCCLFGNIRFSIFFVWTI